MKRFFIISWNEEYLEANLVGGPFEETECEQELCQCLLTGLVKLGVASDETEAQSMYDAAAGNDMPSETLSGAFHRWKHSLWNWVYRILPDKILCIPV